MPVRSLPAAQCTTTAPSALATTSSAARPSRGGARGSRGSARPRTARHATALVATARQRPRADRLGGLARAPAPRSASGGGGSATPPGAAAPAPPGAARCSVRRSTTSVTPSSSTRRCTSASVRSCRLSERISRPDAVCPPLAGRQPAEVTHVDQAVELDPAVRHRVIVGRAGWREWRGAPTARRRPRARDRRAAATTRSPRLGRLAARHLRARAVLRRALRLLRLQHLHADRARPGCVHRDLRRLRARRARPRGARPRRHGAGPVDTVFVGGGTPTLLPAADLVRCVDGIRERFGLAPDAEVTTEANPDSVTAADLEELAAGGFTRVSIGMQSVVPHVLRTLERTHDPARVATAVAGARAAGLGDERRPHLRHAGREPRRLAGEPRRRRRARARPRLGLRARRGGGHPAGGPGAPR